MSFKLANLYKEYTVPNSAFMFDFDSPEFKKWSLALRKYRKASQMKDSKYDGALSGLLNGGQLKSMFIVRSMNPNPHPSKYGEDVKKFGQKKVDDLVNTVLSILNDLDV